MTSFSAFAILYIKFVKGREWLKIYGRTQDYKDFTLKVCVKIPEAWNDLSPSEKSEFLAVKEFAAKNNFRIIDFTQKTM